MYTAVANASAALSLSFTLRSMESEWLEITLSVDHRYMINSSPVIERSYTGQETLLALYQLSRTASDLLNRANFAQSNACVTHYLS